jgi:hypothetical protein
MKHHTHAIYQRGKTHAQNSCHTEDDGTIRANFTTLTGQEYCDEKNAGRAPDEPEYELMTWDEAMPLIEAASEAEYCTGWEEIEKQVWWDALEVLPPEKWRTVAGVEIFRMCEYLSGNITAHYARLEDRYFSRNCRNTVPYADIAAEIADICRRCTCNREQPIDSPVPNFCQMHDGDYGSWLVSNNID